MCRGHEMTETTNQIVQRRIFALYIGLLVTFVAHVLEEIYGNFKAIEYLGQLWFMVINWIFICILAALLYFILIGKRWAYICGIIYAGLLTLNGLAHNIGLSITGQYYGGVAGSFTGLAYLVIGPILIVELRKGMRGGAGTQ